MTDDKRTPSEHAQSLEDTLAEIQKATESRGAETKANVDAAVVKVLEDADDADDTTGIRNLRELAEREGLTLPPAPGDTIRSMPAVTPPPPPPDSSPATLRPKLDADKPRTEHVIIVEDDGDIRDTLAGELRDHGYDVRVAINGLEALDKIFRSSVLPDLIILDIGLPFLTGAAVKAAVETEMYMRGMPPIPIAIITAGTVDRLPPEMRGDHVVAKGGKFLEHLLIVCESLINERRAAMPLRLF